MLWIQGDARESIDTLAPASIHACVTSPPYFGLRDYGVAGQMGQESTPERYLESLAAVFVSLRRVVRNEGSFWLVIGDTYYGGPALRQPKDAAKVRRVFVTEHTCSACGKSFQGRPSRRFCSAKCGSGESTKPRQAWSRPKCLLGIPWRAASAAVSAGWILRNAIIWAKPNALPCGAHDRLACSHEMVFHFVQQQRWEGKRAVTNYHYDRTAIPHRGDVWQVPTRPNKSGHVAAFPEDLIAPMISATCPVGGVVLDPFAGSGTTGKVANRLGRQFVGIDLDSQWAPSTQDAT